MQILLANKIKRKAPFFGSGREKDKFPYNDITMGFNSIHPKSFDSTILTN